jgi:phenylalanyl-tRNA synthetase beta chain
MKIPLEWLNRLVPVTLAPADLAELLTISGLEVESIDETADGVVLDVDILPNMARCLSMLGAAREVAALTRAPLPEMPALADLPPATADRTPAVEDPAVCRRFLAVEVSGVGGLETPEEIARRLEAAGIGAVNALVDVANYVMVEIGQPIHVYDRDLLDGGLLGLRLAAPGDRLLLLTQPPDAPPREIPAGIPLIVDRHGAPATVAGLVGGRATAVRPSTTSIVVEAATFDFLAIRRAQAALALRTDASARFSRGVPASLAETGARRYLQLLREIRPDVQVESFGEWAVEPPLKRTIRLPLADLEHAIGVPYGADEAVAILAGLGLGAEEREGVIDVVVGDDREDLAIPEDLVEEVVRIAGYDRLPATMPTGEMPLPVRDDRLSAERDVREAMVRAGLSEIISYTFSSRRAHVAAGGRADDPFVELVNPLSPERSVLRRSLLPGLLEAVESNLRNSPGVDLFEQGMVALPELPGLDPRLPKEASRVGFVLTGSAEPGARFSDADAARVVDFFDAADIVTGLARHLHVGSTRLDPAEAEPFVAGACAAFVHGDKVIGHVGLVQAAVAERFGIRERDVFAGELDAEVLAGLRRVDYAVREPSRFPDVRLDLSLTVGADVAAGALVAAARAAGGERLRDVWIFDVYEGAGVARGSRAVGLRLSIGDDERTLTTDEATGVRDAIVAALAGELGATPR